MTPSPVRPPAPCILLALALGFASCRGGCRQAEDRAATVTGRLALFPVATQVVAAVDVARLRASPAAAKLAALAEQSESDRHLLTELARRTGLDPLRQLNSVTVAFPKEARAKGELGLIVRADHLDEARLVAYVRDELQKTGDDLLSTRHGRFTLWSLKRDPRVVAFFVDDRTLALGVAGWGERMAELAETARPGDSAATNVDLVRLVERAAGTHAVWGAAIVPAETRQVLAADPASASAAGIATLSVGIDLGKGLAAALVADMGSPAEAHALTTKAAESLRDAKRSPQVLMLGLGPYLDGVSVRAVDRTFELDATIDERGLGDLVSRLAAFLSLARGGSPPGFGAGPLPLVPPSP